MKEYRDLAYGPDPRNRLDLFLPDDSETHDLFFYFHGGGFTGGSKNGREAFYGDLVRAGVIVATADYRLYPNASYPDFVEDAAQAVAWVKEHISEYASVRRFVIGGTSAGGYLSMMLCFDPEWLGKYGLKAADFGGFFHDAGQPTTHFNVLKERGLDPARVIVDEAAPLYYVGLNMDLPPMYFVVSDHDMKNRYEQILLTISALKNFGFDPAKIGFELRHGTHCHYCKELDENGNSVFAKMVLGFIRSL